MKKNTIFCDTIENEYALDLDVEIELEQKKIRERHYLQNEPTLDEQRLRALLIN